MLTYVYVWCVLGVFVCVRVCVCVCVCACMRVCFQYQRVLNSSIEKMSGIFTNFREDGWQELSESGET